MYDVIIFLADSKMFRSQRILLIDGFTLIGLCMISLLGDCLCFGRPLSVYILSNSYLRALTDNFTHGLVSVLATCFLFGWTRRELLIILLKFGLYHYIVHYMINHEIDHFFIIVYFC